MSTHNSASADSTRPRPSFTLEQVGDLLGARSRYYTDQDAFTLSQAQIDWGCGYKKARARIDAGLRDGLIRAVTIKAPDKLGRLIEQTAYILTQEGENRIDGRTEAVATDC